MDSADIFNDMVGNLKGELSDGYSLISEFVERQGRLLAKQADHLAKTRVDGYLKDEDELFTYFLDGLARDTVNMVRSLAMLTVLTIEKAWNAVANALWGGLTTILTAAGFPVPLIPKAPPSV
ncbi:hypothetical protein [Parasphingorhabdus halotolerans]|uniref:Uncharacterized protein n=1 Tax=Parasphingorhabdus halotolerans TaxID=2725558 RepID=A0A6H2DPW6_9SPHN|nr:hypothetical protein [Parasphingorhabdus halotolerans]QJB70005.1 hypothetical protein HF685_12495 [Parasphingorhabdus halotolerans]